MQVPAIQARTRMPYACKSWRVRRRVRTFPLVGSLSNIPADLSRKNSACLVDHTTEKQDAAATLLDGASTSTNSKQQTPLTESGPPSHLQRDAHRDRSLRRVLDRSRLSRPGSRCSAVSILPPPERKGRIRSDASQGPNSGYHAIRVQPALLESRPELI
jgi:hypothetical protein